MKPLFAAVACAALLGAALPALAQPAPDEDLRLLGQTDEFAYFFSESSRTPAGQDIDVWVLAALQRTTHTAEGDDVVGGWFRMRVTCANGTIYSQESMLIRRDFTTTLHSLEPDPPQPARPDSPYGVLRDFLCGGVSIEPDVRASDLTDALRLTRGLFADPRVPNQTT